MAKIEIVEFDGGYYAARRITRHFFFFKSIEYLRLGGTSWTDPGGDYIERCFNRDVQEVKKSLAISGYGNGIPITRNMLVSLDECTKMNEMAENDEGMKDTLLKAKEYFLLKRK